MSMLGRFLDRIYGFKRRGTPPMPSQQAPEPVLLPPETSLLTLPKFIPAGFQHGVEILNDNKTEMEFVVTALITHFGLSRQQSVRLMLNIHTRGGALLPTSSMDAAEKAATDITAAARERGFPFICRAVSKAM